MVTNFMILLFIIGLAVLFGWLLGQNKTTRPRHGGVLWFS
jgi:predicted negative regulator of RcsB-dependent stress response